MKKAAKVREIFNFLQKHVVPPHRLYQLEICLSGKFYKKLMNNNDETITFLLTPN
jgi:hypothetical protein